MIVAFDSYYTNGQQKTVCVLFSDWEHPEINKSYTGFHKIEDSYHSGEFYKRELPGILHLIHEVGLEDINTILVDAFVWLDDNETPGLGGRLYHALNEKIPVIGIAKTDFATIHQNKRKLFRGKSIRPLFITSAGIDTDLATNFIKNLPGKFRIPDVLRELDRLTKVK